MKVNLPVDFGLPRELLVTKKHESSIFYEELSKASKAQLKNQAEIELDIITKLGRTVCENMTLASLKEFKDRIAQFLNMCISGGLCFKEERFRDRNGRIKALSVVKIINQKLLELADELLSENKDSLKVIALVDEICGLLVDIYV
ncbi:MULTISPECIES: YaaR family protein [Tepidanaerobacter]|uniref:YaaR family protein n=1 Tax=Tepidanaerobacter syntrophicus TaxID=224999 RepID=A0A0U9HDG7_9FIRM|nr:MULTISPECIES: YaaR family protein [Tepidanaerobacter]GAQ24850.1 hypothetical protein TSYNT_6231 [Tepidanaerobacter syntrophicus]GLI18882.1 hypothetical protein TSYNTROPHJE_06950 [Tepidanaerobacter syntrophicus]